MKQAFKAASLQLVHHKKNIQSYTFGIALILLMICAAIVLQDREIILPELAALATGCFVYMKPEWTSRPWELFKLPSITAIIGFGINMTTFSLVLKLILVVSAMLLVLTWLRNYLAPALATGLLPVITNATSPTFLAAIFILTFLLAWAVASFKTKNTSTPAQTPQFNLQKGDIAAYLTIIIGWMGFCFYTDRMDMAATPPVLVVAFESIQKQMYTRKVWLKQIFLLTIAALIGSLTTTYFSNMILGASTSFLAIYLVLHISKFKLPPAYAMALLPLILPTQPPLHFTIKVFLMALFILSTIYVLKKYVANKSEISQG
ncbi:hypothetical protein E2P86_06605 [Sphingobacterium psychroaquaticum]|uniref:hypothetical protein n=1 Tax=Sphingobacterium psychroaquaticum TaxID=561061 RepID=UPI001069D3B5|nr:hypothetical protein [Sphingobacterium psychroaquaticum]QBQ40838.1 hypothetical protein E2P86_06605 [Sphingobacterium psychroaquaticum]